MKSFFYFNKKAVSLIEIIIVISIFSLFLLGFHLVLNTGLKNWKMGEMKSDIQGSAEIVMKRMITELQLANAMGLQVDTAGHDMDLGGGKIKKVHEFICFETPVRNGILMYDSKKMGNPYWQGYIIYFVLPQDSTGAVSKKLYRRYIPHDLPAEPDPGWEGKTDAVPMLMTELMNRLNTDVTGNEILKPVSTDLTYADFSINGCIVNLELAYSREIRKNSNVSFSTAPNPGGGIERFVIKNAVEPKN